LWYDWDVAFWVGGFAAGLRFVVFAAVFLLVVVVSSLVLVEVLPKPPQPDVLVGVDVAFGNEEDVYRVADAVRGFANLIILGTTAVTNDTAKLTRICDYLYQRGFSFIVYVGFAKEGYFPPNGPGPEFFNTTVKRWGDKFLGAYIFDEIGGKQLDYSSSNGDKPVPNATDYSDAAQKFVHILHNSVNLYKNTYYNAPDLKTFTSDYGLYWFDYLFGYNAVFGEFVGNQSRQLAIARCRGAANVQNMSWGTMITWKYDRMPFLENGAELYNDMRLAYDNGADYVVVFDGSENQTATSSLGTLQPEHLDAMKQFWNYALSHQRPQKDPADTAYVLPRDYGFGFRGPNDNIWGLWYPNGSSPADSLAPQIWSDANSLISTYGLKLDIVYETLSSDLAAALPYDRLIFWNGTTIQR
jgi:hypothetical protein